MGFLTGAVIGGSLLGAGSSIYGAKKASKAAGKAQQTETAEAQRQFDLTRQDTAPQRELGNSAIEQIRRVYGYGTPQAGGTNAAGSTASVAPDMSGFFTSPDYTFNLAEGQQAIDRSAAARGGLLSGRAVKEGERYASGLASGEFSNYMSRLFQQAGIGAQGVATSANMGANTAGLVANASGNAGNQRASAYMAGAGGVNNALQGGLGNMLMMQYLKPQTVVRNI
ncbi:MAG: hypothetical protein ACKO0Z_24560 [Betaproteobacteria bacterium]